MTEIYDEDVQVTMRPVSDTAGLPYTVNPVQLSQRQALIEIREGAKGPSGAEGAPAWPWIWQGDIADPAAIDALGLTTADARKAWRVVSENAIYIWTGMELVPLNEAFLAPGKQGAPNVLTGSGTAGATGSSATAAITGTAPNQHLAITFPQGVQGDTGDPGAAGAIQDASDVAVDEDHPLAQDYVLAWDTTLNKFRPVPSARNSGPWSIAGGQFTGGSNINVSPKVIATITIPAQPMQWRPIVEGGLVVYSHVNAVGDSRMDVEVRIGSTDGDLVGYGCGLAAANDNRVSIAPRFAFPMTPTATFGVVPANTTTTLYVLVRRVTGSSNYTVTTEHAQLIVYAQAVR
ncbi:hypothetical protein [Nocardia sp. CY41]|uniref:hypothetical protein n=1 Tax=Nocardia sp. CY41 TaxID=2608686 RepID=UPI001359FFA0|nr:hypothetical protein [Nocardia sp. CY41]